MHLNLLMFLGGLFLQKETKSIFDCISLEDKFMILSFYVLVMCLKNIFKSGCQTLYGPGLKCWILLGLLSSYSIWNLSVFHNVFLCMHSGGWCFLLCDLGLLGACCSMYCAFLTAVCCWNFDSLTYLACGSTESPRGARACLHRTGCGTGISKPSYRRYCLWELFNIRKETSDFSSCSKILDFKILQRFETAVQKLQEEVTIKHPWD